MMFYKTLARKRLKTERTETLLLIITIALATATLMMTLNLSGNYLVCLIEKSTDIIGADFPDLLKNNLENLSEIGMYAADFFGRMGGDINSTPIMVKNLEAIFSPSSSVENLPSTMVFLSAVVLVMVNTILSIVFNLCQKSRRSFLVTMLASGDTQYGIKEYVRRETQELLFAGIPVGVLIGIAGIYTVRFIGKIIFENRGFSLFPVDVNVSVIPSVVTVLLITLLTFKFSKRVCKEISVTQVASSLKTKLASDNGIRTMTAEPERYIKKGMEHFVSIGNFSSNIIKYMGMLGTTSITLLVFTMTVLIFDIIRNYNGQALLNGNPKIMEMSVAAEMYFICVAIPLVVISVLGMFSSVFASTASNVGIYALMKSSGSTVGSVLRTVRKEGNFTALTCCLFVTFVTFYIIAIIVSMFISDRQVDLVGMWKIPLISAAAIILIFVSIMVTTRFMRKKMKKLDIIGILKNLYY